MVKNFVSEIINELDVGLSKTRVALIYFSDNSEIHFDLNDYERKEDVLQAVKSIPYLQGRTNIASALKQVRESIFNGRDGDRSNIPNHCIGIYKYCFCFFVVN